MLLNFAGESLVLSHKRAIFWQAGRTLFIADFHLGKEEYFQAQGVPIPGSSQNEVSRLEELLRDYDAKIVWVLGDFVHHASVLGGESWSRFERLCSVFSGVQFRVVRGNHDRGLQLPASSRVEMYPEGFQVGPFTLSHYPREGGGPWLSGHIHPVCAVGSAADAMSLPCFYHQQGGLILPAFSEFTSGMAVSTKEGLVYLIADELVIELPLGY